MSDPIQPPPMDPTPASPGLPEIPSPAPSPTPAPMPTPEAPPMAPEPSPLPSTPGPGTPAVTPNA